MSARVTSPLTRSVLLFVAICSTAGVPVWFAWSADRGGIAQTLPRPSLPVEPPASNVAEMLARSRSTADARNQAALVICTSEITSALDRRFTDLYFTAESTASGIATYKNCVKIIAMMASDTVRGRSDAREWVQARIERQIDPQISDVHREIHVILDRFDRELNASTLTMATEVAAIGGTAAGTSVSEHAAGLDGLSLEAALGRLGFEGGLLAPAVAVDIYGLLQTRVVRWLVVEVVDLAKWIFARPIAAAVTEAGLVAADGPLPIGDAIAVVGAAWTAYDIYALRNHFEKKLTDAIREAVPEVRRTIEQQIWTRLREQVASHAAIQTRMHDETSRNLLP